MVLAGERRRLPASVDLAAYRIVQESLTNVLRHAGRTCAVVGVAYGDEEVTITVDDDGRGHRGGSFGVNGDAAVQPGHGILGMRERAHALGGELEAGPRASGGFRVSARLPIAADS